MFDGLEIAWHAAPGATVHVNPPFKHAGLWAHKIIAERNAGHCSSVALLCGARTQPEWFHDTVMQYADVVCVVRKGIKYVGYNQALAYGSILALFRAPLVRKPNGVTLVSHTVRDWA